MEGRRWIRGAIITRARIIIIIFPSIQLDRKKRITRALQHTQAKAAMLFLFHGDQGRLIPLLAVSVHPPAVLFAVRIARPVSAC